MVGGGGGGGGGGQVVHPHLDMITSQASIGDGKKKATTQQHFITEIKIWLCCQPYTYLAQSLILTCLLI